MAAAALAVAAGSASAGSPAHAELAQAAYGESLAVEHGDLVLYIVYAERSARFKKGELRTFAVAIKAPCHKFYDDGDLVGYVCSGHGTAREIPSEAFQFDPLLASASVTFKDGRYRQQASWTGRGSRPTLVGGAFVAGPAAFAGGELARSARVSARLFGKRFGKGAREAYGFLEQWADAVADGETSSDLPRAVREPGRTVRIKRTIEIPAER